MVKTPSTRHSKSTREPVTIDLEPDAVRRVDDNPATDPADVPASVEEAPFVAENPVTEAVEPVAGSADDRPLASSASESAETTAPETIATPDTAASGGSMEPPVEDKPRAAAPEPAPRRSGASSLLAGVAGAVVALAIAGGLQYAGVLGSLSGQENERIAALEAQLAGTKQDIQALANRPDDTSGLQELRNEFAALKTQVDGDDGTAQALNGLDERLKTVETAVSDADRNGATVADLAALSDKVAGLEALVKSAGETSSANEGRLAMMEQSVSGLNSKVEAQAEQPRIALAVAATALKSSIERGAPFSAELETLATIAPDAPELAKLKPYADKGVPTREDIAAQMNGVADAIISAGTPVNPDAGYIDQIWQSARSLVQVRPVGAVSGTGVPEIVARMEAAVVAGDYKKALAEYDSLPEQAKAAGAGFAETMRARLEVETLVDQLVATAMKA